MPTSTSTAPYSSLSCMQTFIVPTKTYDGGTKTYDDSHSDTTTSKERRQQHSDFDAFSYYSSQYNRMSMFYGPLPQDVTTSRVDDDESATSKRRRVSISSIEATHTEAAPTVVSPRRTRLSFEVHPSLLMLHEFEFYEQGRISTKDCTAE